MHLEVLEPPVRLTGVGSREAAETAGYNYELHQIRVAVKRMTTTEFRIKRLIREKQIVSNNTMNTDNRQNDGYVLDINNEEQVNIEITKNNKTALEEVCFNVVEVLKK